MKTASHQWDQIAPRGVLLRIHRRQPLSAKAFDLGLILLERAPQSVSRRELQGLLWPETASLPTNVDLLVGELRSAIFSADEPLWILEDDYGFRADLPWLSERGEGAPALLHWGDVHFRLWSGANIVGRDALCDVVIEHPTVSRRHACIEIVGREYTIEDLHSRNGTFVEEAAVLKPVALSNGANIRFGDVTVRLFMARTAGARGL